MIPLLTVLLLAITLFQTQGAQGGEVANAAKSGDIETLTRLLDEGAPVDEPGAAHPLHFACMSGQTDAARLLLERGADPDADSALGTPLMVAAGRDRVEIVELLLAQGADPNVPGGREQRTPLHAAAFAGATASVQILLDHGADPMARTKHGATALHLAVLKNRAADAELLRDVTRWTPPKPPTESDIAFADVDKGREAAELCKICHPVEFGVNAKGPSLWNVVERPVASIEGFPYSQAMRDRGGAWDIASLDAFLADPKMAMPGNVMAASNDCLEVAERETRWAIIAYLNTLK